MTVYFRSSQYLPLVNGLTKVYKAGNVTVSAIGWQGKVWSYLREQWWHGEYLRCLCVSSSFAFFIVHRRASVKVLLQRINLRNQITLCDRYFLDAKHHWALQIIRQYPFNTSFLRNIIH